MSRPGIFLDRDGTLNVRPAEHASPSEFRWLPGAQVGAARLAQADYVLAVVSNQRGIARSWMIGDSETDVLARQAAGCRTALVGASPEACTPDLVAHSLDAASALILFEEPGLSRDSPSRPRTLRPEPDRWSGDRPRG